MSLTFSTRQAIAQLRFVWPGVVARHKESLTTALVQVDEAFVDRFLADHPRADACCIARCGRHEVILRGLSRREPVVYWVEGRLLGQYRAVGAKRREIERARSLDERALRQPRVHSAASTRQAVLT
ncbi:hypothetical protein [Sphingopyxis sp.]|uniref:hypothetical protein n=1 Tax=Sphingopyxis sp. TaxID=1908224 RepID=UPI0026085AEF|nr:hypothetical protein [Sphingopyxis sp.]MCW0198225.1 hypothetical protein [Sphingopyxis sp.]